MTGWWFSPGTPVSSTKKTDHQDITEILLKVALNTITLTPIPTFGVLNHEFISSLMIWVYVTLLKLFVFSICELYLFTPFFLNSFYHTNVHCLVMFY